jgi:hypothetical protein
MRLRSALLLFAALGGLALAAEPEEAITVAGTGHPQHPVSPKNDKIWSAVVVATDVTTPKEPPKELAAFAAKLKRVFGYNQFEVVGSATEVIDELTESWLVPNPIFSFSVKARRATSVEARGGYLLSLKFFQEKKPVVDAETKLAPGSPLFIRGPQYGKGQVIIVLQVQH